MTTVPETSDRLKRQVKTADPALVRVLETRVSFDQLSLTEDLHSHPIDLERLDRFVAALRSPRSWLAGYRVECVAYRNKLVVIDGRLVALAYLELGRGDHIPVRIYEGLPPASWLIWRYRRNRNQDTRTASVMRTLAELYRWFRGWRHRVQFISKELTRGERR